MKVRSKMALLVVALASVAALSAGTVYAISIEVPARGTFVTNKDKVELHAESRGWSASRRMPRSRRSCSSRARGRTGTPTPAPSR